MHQSRLELGDELSRHAISFALVVGLNQCGESAAEKADEMKEVQHRGRMRRWTARVGTSHCRAVTSTSVRVTLISSEGIPGNHCPPRLQSRVFAMFPASLACAQLYRIDCGMCALF